MQYHRSEFFARDLGDALAREGASTTGGLSMRNWWLVAAGVSGAIAVGMGAFGAHGLRDALVALGFSPAEVEARIAERYEPAVLYHLVHSAALGVVALAAAAWPARVLRVAGGGFLAGIVLFSGLLYVLTFNDVQGLGAVVPLGGLAYIVGWLALAAAGLMRRAA
jgi:uncharacterized membrane protein YgdD (TMEM256/DUF423 family)